MDGDGDTDVIIASQGADNTAITFYENRLAGDVDDDGAVAFADFLKLSNNFGHSDATWEDGDLDHDGVVGFSDFLILSDNFGNKRPPVIAANRTTVAADDDQPETLRIAAADEVFASSDQLLLPDALTTD